MNNAPATAQVAARPTYVIRQGVCMRWEDAIAYDKK